MSKGNIKDALQLAGTQHRYQKILIVLISFSWIIQNFMLLGSTLIFMDPVFHCNGDFQKKVFQKQACPQVDSCELIAKFTLTSSLNLYCENEWARDLIQSIFSVGCIIGLFVMNLVSDTKSRKLAIMLCLSIIFVGLSMTAMGGWQNSIPTIIVAQFIQGLGISSIVPLSYAILSDFTSEKLKPRAIIIVNTAWSFSIMLVGIFYLVSLQWYIFIIFIMIIPLVSVFVLFHHFLLESPQILMLRNKRQQAIQVLEKVCKINSRQENISQLREIVMSQQVKTAKNQAILKQWEFLKPLIIIAIIRAIGAVNFYGTSYAFGVQGLGLGYNSMIAGLLQIISYFALTIFIHRIPRKKGIAGFYFLVFLMGLLFLFPFVKQNPVVETMFMGVSRIFSTISYTLIASVQTQSFRAQIQSTAVGITEVFGLFGSMFGPLIVDLGDKIDVDPVVLIAVLVNFAVWPTYFLKQTLKPQKDKSQPLLGDSQDDDIQKSYKQSILSQSTIVSSEQY